MVYFEKRATGNGLKMILGAAGSEDPVENAGILVRSPRPLNIWPWTTHLIDPSSPAPYYA